MFKISVFGLRQHNQFSVLTSYLQSQIPCIESDYLVYDTAKLYIKYSGYYSRFFYLQEICCLITVAEAWYMGVYKSSFEDHKCSR